MRARTIIIILVVITALVLIKIFLLSDPGKKPSKGKEEISSVSVFVVQPSVLENTLPSSGTIIASEEVELRSETSGRIIRLYFKEGSKVNKGDLLVKINDAELQAQLKKLELQVKLASETESRQKKLFDAGGVSQQDYDVVLSQLNTLKADMDIVKAGLQETEIIAPFSGIIGLKFVSEGSYITPSSRIASIQQVDPVKIDLSIPEKYSGMVMQGDSIRFSVQGSDKVYTGSIYAIEPKIDQSTRTIQLRAICPNKDAHIFPGSFAKIELLLHSSSGNLMIPSEALIPELKGQKVYLVKNGLAFSQKVETGIRTDARVQITNGLHAGDSVITAGLMQIKPNGKVKVVK